MTIDLKLQADETRFCSHQRLWADGTGLSIHSRQHHHRSEIDIMSTPYCQPFWFSEAVAQEGGPSATPLQGNIRTDVCIVGGGYTGLWTAIQLKLKKPDLEVVIVDKGLCGSGASGRNGGCMLTWSTKYLSLKRLYGEQEAIRLVRASEDALVQIRDFCLKYGIEAQVRLDGTLYTATNSAQLGSMDPVIAELNKAAHQ